jgi:integrase
MIWSDLVLALPPRLQCLVWFIAEAGCRSGEAFNLTWKDVDFKTGAVAIRSKEGWTPKAKQSARRIFAGAALLEAMSRLPRRGAYVFAGRKPDRPITNIRKAFASAAKKAGLTSEGPASRFTPHALRKAYATRLALSGVPQRVLQANLGHSAGSRVTDQYYVFASEAARRSAVAPLPIPANALTAGNIGQQPSEAAAQAAEAAD